MGPIKLVLPRLENPIAAVANMNRCVEPELLDELPADDPRAMRSRSDLRRVNAFMGNAAVIARALLDAPGGRSTGQLVDLGAGDGTFMLKLAKRLWPAWTNVEVTLVDRQDIVHTRTHREFESLTWRSRSVAADVFDWLEHASEQRVDWVVANLFLHHFSDAALRRLMKLISGRTNGFAACEPRRYPAALRASRWLWLLGCNQVTRHDAVASVRAGFDGRELSGFWPGNGNWQLREEAAGLFSHRFVARQRDSAPVTPAQARHG